MVVVVVLVVVQRLGLQVVAPHQEEVVRQIKVMQVVT
jgi:hypothetical protein